MSNSSALLEGLPPEALWRLEEVCNRFEHLWQAGQRPSLGEFLGGSQGPERVATLGELLRLDVYYRRLAGESPSSRDYEAWLPEDAPPLKDLLPEGDATAGPGDADRTTDHHESPPPAEADPPTRAGRFRVRRFHAAGALGEVFVAVDEELRREVALKEIRRQFQDQEGSRRRFVLEATVTGNLEHPGIVPVYGLGTYPDGRPYYAMRLIQGETLEVALERFHRQAPMRFDSLEFRQLLGRLVAVCQAVAYAHDRGVLHRDLKPGNIMLGKFGETLVVDWGLAKVLGRDPAVGPEAGEDGLLGLREDRAAETVGVVGTPAYMSPEQARGGINELGSAADVYSLGATLYAVLTGRAPFQGRADEVLREVQIGRWAPPRQVNGAVPAELDAICRKAMALWPGARYASAQALAEDLEHWLGDEPVAAAPDPLGARVRRWMRKRPRSVAAAVTVLAALVLGLAAGAFLLERSKREAEENFRTTREAALTFLVAVNEEELMNEPGMHIVRYRLLVKALTYYQEFLRKRPGDLKVKAEMASVTRQLGELFREKGDAGRAGLHVREARQAYEELVGRQPADGELRLGLAQTLLAAAELSLQAGDLSAAEQDASRAVEEVERTRQTAPDHVPALKVLGRALDTRATARAHLGRADEAIKDNSEAGRTLFYALLVLFTEDSSGHNWERHEDMAEKRGEFGTCQLLFRAWLNQGVLQRTAGRPAEAWSSLMTAHTLAERLQENYRYLQIYHPRSARLVVNVAAARLHAGWAALDLGLPDAALPLLESSVELSRGAVEALPGGSGAEPRRLLALGTGLAGEARFRRGQYGPAVTLLNEALERTGELIRGDPTGSLLTARMHFQVVLGRLEAERGNLAAAMAWCERTEPILRMVLQRRSADRRLRADWMATRRLMIRARQRLGGEDGAARTPELEALLVESRALAAEAPGSPVYRREVGAAAADLAGALVEANRAADAVGAIDAALPDLERLVAEDDLWWRLRHHKPPPVDQDPLRNNPRGKAYQIDRLGLPKDFWGRHPAREPEDLRARQILGELLATRAVALARLGREGEAGKLAGRAEAVAVGLADGPSGVPLLPVFPAGAWGTIAEAVASREPCYLYDLACYQSLAAASRREPADRAAATVRAMAALGVGDPNRVKADPRLRALRSRPDFGELLQPLDAKTRPAP